jgi:ketosteroid isomerase-like protein
MGQHRNLLGLARGLRAFAEHDLGILHEIFAESVRWHAGGTSGLAGTYEGLDEVFELFARRAALSGDSYRFELEEAIANDAFVTVLAQVRATREDRAYEDRVCLVFRIAGDRVVEAWGHPGDPEAEARFFG